MTDPDHLRIFEEARPNLLGLAYRILGTLADAEDAVQDSFLKWAKAERAAKMRPASCHRTSPSR